MSLDYPNRTDWLKIRCKYVPKTNYLFVSAEFVDIPSAGRRILRTATCNIGRNKTKRFAGPGHKARKAARKIVRQLSA